MEGFCGKNCDTCNVLGNGCMKYKDREDAPMMCQQAAEQKQQRQRWCAENASQLGKWLWMLFWLVIPSFLTNLMTNENIVQLVPGLRMPGEILSLLCNLAYGFLLWQLHKQGARYRTAAICTFATVTLNVLSMILVGYGSKEEMAGLALLILIPSMVVSLYATYQEYHAHAGVLDGLDDELAENWRKLWKWEVGFLLGLVGCLLFVLISAWLGLLAMISVLTGILVVSILKLAYLYRMAKFFREYFSCEAMEGKK